MLTLKLINERTEWVIKGLEKKHFSGAKEAIENVLATDKKRREAQTQLDINLSESKKLAAQIGALMKQGKKEEAESIKTEVARLKDTNKALLRVPTFPGGTVPNVQVCRCVPVPLSKIRASGSGHAHPYRRNRLHDGNIAYRRNS